MADRYCFELCLEVRGKGDGALNDEIEAFRGLASDTSFRLSLPGL